MTCEKNKIKEQILQIKFPLKPLYNFVLKTLKKGF